MNLKSAYYSAENIAFIQLTELGSLVAYVFFMLAFLILGKADTFIQLFISLFFVMVVAILIKSLYFKKRPSKHLTRNFVERLDAASFPSIHSMRTFSLVFWISLYFNNLLLTVYLSIVGVFVVYSRIYLKKHYWVDVIFGLIFSFIINHIIWWAL